MVKISIVHGDLLDQDVDVIVNAWNRNLIPWWLLLPQGVSGAIKRLAGLRPFRELPFGLMPLGVLPASAIAECCGPRAATGFLAGLLLAVFLPVLLFHTRLRRMR